jgi:hypothetical protein
MMAVLLQIHSLVRWLVLAAGLAAAGKYAFGLLRHTPFGQADRILGATYAGALDAQAVLGLALLVSLSLQSNSLPPTQYILHAAAMFFALAAAHQTARWRDAADARRYRNGLIAFGLSLALVVLGLLVVVQSS